MSNELGDVRITHHEIGLTGKTGSGAFLNVKRLLTPFYPRERVSVKMGIFR